jgi:hypothetical protein
MLKLTDIYEHIFTRVNKDQSGNTYGLNQFNVDLAIANTEMFSYLYGLPQAYRPGMPLPPVAFEVSQRIIDNLKNCKVNMGGSGPNDASPLEVVNGIAPMPLDYVHFVRMSYVQTFGSECKDPNAKTPRNLEILTDAAWVDRIGNYIKNKNVAAYPYCNFQGQYIEFRPKWEYQNINFVYLRMPKRPFLDYVIRPDGSYYFLLQGQLYLLQPGEVYSGGATAGQVISKTQELEWDDEVKPEIANLIIGYIADNLRQPYLKQVAEARKVRGI